MFFVEEAPGPTAASRDFEIVERKGLGHPDSICDAVMEEAARALVREYLDRFGRIQHFNLDKALLAAGEANPRFGGGRVERPMRFVFGDRAVAGLEGMRLPVAELVEQTARGWLAENLPELDSRNHIVFQSELRAGSPELSALYASPSAEANDTSTGVGFYPWTETERLVLEAEQYLNGVTFKSRFPETGQDVKVMGMRRGSELSLTVAIAFVDRLVDREATYFRRKAEVEADLADHLRARLERLDNLELSVNALDAAGRGEAGAYLTVTGTSAEGADSGEVGRGNRLTGFISSTRPWSAEAVAGKNPLCHVGKVYNHLAQRAAQRISELEGIAEATVFLVSRIGAPLAAPQFSAVSLSLQPGAGLDDSRELVESTVARTLRESRSFVADWLRGDLPEQRR